MSNSKIRRLLTFLIIAGVLAGCSKQKTKMDFYATDLFKDVQLKSVFPDSKTFVDCTPRGDLQDIVAEYDRIKSEADFDLKEFVHRNFELPVRPKSLFSTDTTLVMEEHITRLWPLLTRKADEKNPKSSLLPLPYDYVVPGGRFSEVYYWDSYFTILGLKTQKRYDLIQNMVNNFAFLIDSVGFIPNANRNYYITRSQPPFFSLIVKELEEYDSMAAGQYLNSLLKEYAFWMDGVDSLKNPGDAVEHVVMMSDGSVLNRYYDQGDTPRPEAYKEDYALGQKQQQNERKLYRDLRSAAESGWDFSSRWFENGKDLATIHTTDIIPVDLNCLMAHLERMIAKGYKIKGENDKAASFNKRADLRRRAVLTFFWDPERDFFFDYDFVKNKKCDVKSLAGIYPLFFEMAQKDIADKAAGVIEREFLKQGGVVTSLTDTDQQWDAPNGWAPLQWMTYKGLRNYQIDKLAEQIRKRWLRQNERVFEATGKMMEKYNVMDTTLIAGGGEYPNQDGFGWTNGVALAFKKESLINLPKK
jgi:alpha,alpha-trehalase